MPTGMIASEGFEGGAWNTDPSSATITGTTTFTYTFMAKQPPTPVTKHTVTYVVVDGTWADGTVMNKTEEVEDGQSPAKIPTGMIPSTGFTGGAWDTNPATATITGATTFTYTFEAFSYGIITGTDGSWTKGSGKTYTITVKRSVNDSECFSHFTGVEIDGVLLAANAYTASSGSTVVTLKATTLQKLSTGTHTVTILFDDGSVSTKLTIKANPASPATDDRRLTGLWAWLTGLSALGMGCAAFLQRKRRYAGKH